MMRLLWMHRMLPNSYANHGNLWPGVSHKKRPPQLFVRRPVLRIGSESLSDARVVAGGHKSGQQPRRRLPAATRSRRLPLPQDG